MAHAWLMVTPKSLLASPKRPPGVASPWIRAIRSTPPKAWGSTPSAAASTASLPLAPPIAYVTGFAGSAQASVHSV